MTNNAFFTAIVTCKDQFVWTVDKEGCIRATHLHSPANRLCPWTALALTQGHAFPPNQFWRAAWLVGRTAYPRATRLANIADGSYRQGDEAAAVLRARMETCLELTEIPHGKA